MSKKCLVGGILVVCAASLLILTNCGRVHAQGEAAAATAGAPPELKIVPDVDVTLFAVEHPEQFPLATAEEHPATSELVVTGTVTPDVSRNVPVVSLASGRVIT